MNRQPTDAVRRSPTHLPINPYTCAPKKVTVTSVSLRRTVSGFEKNMNITMNINTIFALDLGTITGWALRAPEGQIAHGFVSFKSQRFEGGGMRYLRFRRWLTEMKATVAGTQGLGAVYFEEVRRHMGVDAAHVYGGLLATLTAWCEHHQIPYQGVPVGTIKRHATGKGKAGKEEVIAAMRSRGFAPGCDNQADALALLDWALSQGGVQRERAHPPSPAALARWWHRPSSGPRGPGATSSAPTSWPPRITPCAMRSSRPDAPTRAAPQSWATGCGPTKTATPGG